jgi:hypothetical protein
MDFNAGTLKVDAAGCQHRHHGRQFHHRAEHGAGREQHRQFCQWRLSISATGSNGVLQDDATTPSRGAAGFSQFFGLNDLLSPRCPRSRHRPGGRRFSGLPAGGVITMSLKAPMATSSECPSPLRRPDRRQCSHRPEHRGRRRDLHLNPDGSISTATSALYPGYALNVTGDTTQRGATGELHPNLRLGANAPTGVGFA